MKSKLLLLVFLFFCVSSINAQEWKPMFDGQSFDGWETQGGKAVDEETAPAWEVTDGMMHLDRTNGKGGNLLSDREYGDFELVFEWKVAPEANNGIKYRVQDFDGKVLGLEYQVIDDFGQPKLKPKHKTASIYDIYEVEEHNALQPADVWNRGRILVQNNRIEHWLNGKLITQAEVGSEEWNERMAKSKFSDVPGFGINTFGRIMLSDHNDEVWYRNLFIRDLSSSFQSQASQQVATSTPTCLPQAQTISCGCQPTRARRSFFRRRRR